MFTKEKRYHGPSSPSALYAVFFGDQFLRMLTAGTVITTLAHTSLPVTLFTLWVLVIGSILALGIVRPWSKPFSVTRKQAIALAGNGAALAALTFGTLYLLKICGPIRTMLLQNADRVFAGILGVIMGRKLQHGKSRGIAMAMVGVILLLWFAPAQMHYDPIAASPSNTVDAVEKVIPDSLSAGARELMAAVDAKLATAPDAKPDTASTLDLGGAEGDLGTDPLVAPGSAKAAAKDDTFVKLAKDSWDLNLKKPAEEEGEGTGPGVKHKLKKFSKEMMRHADRMKKTLDAEDATSVFVGGAWLIALIALNTVVQRATKKASGDLGGRKRFTALSLPFAAVLWLPFSVYQFAWNWSISDSQYHLMSPIIMWSAALYAAFHVVLPEYVVNITSPKIDERTAKLYGGLFSLVAGIILAYFHEGDSQLNWALYPGAILVLIGSQHLISPSLSDVLGGSYSHGGLSSQAGSFLSSWGLLSGPAHASGDTGGGGGLFHDEDDVMVGGGTGAGIASARAHVSFATHCKRILRHVMEDTNSRKIFIFLVINLVFMVVEVVVGIWTNSLGLISDAGHMAFDNFSLMIGLYASYMSKWRRDEEYTYGRSRYEVVGGFVNAIFLICIAVAIVLEGVERLWEPPEINSDNLLAVAVLGFAVNMVGLFFFHDSHSHGGHGHGDHGHSHSNENMQGIFLHVLADALGSAGVIISTLMIQFWGWYLADPIASLIIAILILLSVLSLIQSTANVLLSRVPEGMEITLRDCVVQIARLQGVIRVTQPHFWKLQGENVVGTLHVLVEDSADEQAIRKHVVTLLGHCGITQTTVQVMKQSFMATLAAAQGYGNTGSTPHQPLLANNPQLEFTAASQLSGLPLGGAHHGHSHGHGSACESSSHSGHHGHAHDSHHGHSHGGSGGACEEHGDHHGHGHSSGVDHQHEHSQAFDASVSSPFSMGGAFGGGDVWGNTQKRVRIFDPKALRTTVPGSPGEVPTGHGHSHGGAPCSGHHDEPTASAPSVTYDITNTKGSPAFGGSFATARRGPSFLSGSGGDMVQLSTPIRPAAAAAQAEDSGTDGGNSSKDH